MAKAFNIQLINAITYYFKAIYIVNNCLQTQFTLELKKN